MEEEEEITMRRNMDLVFESAKNKAFWDIKNYDDAVFPWICFTTEQLIKMLDDGLDEWEETDNGHELLDIINLAAFVWLSKFYDNIGCKNEIL